MDIFDVQKEKIITPIYSTTNKFGLDSASDDENYFTLSDTTAIQLKDGKYNLKTILAILNSKLMNFYFRKNTKLKRDNYCEYITESLQKIPIKQNSASDKKIVPLVEKILSLNKRATELKDKQTDQKAQLEKEIQKLDNEIDEEVYKLYGITEDEKKIIED